MHPIGHKRPGLDVNLAFSIGVIIDICVSQQHVKFDPSYGGAKPKPVPSRFAIFSQQTGVRLDFWVFVDFTKFGSADNTVIRYARCGHQV